MLCEQSKEDPKNSSQEEDCNHTAQDVTHVSSPLHCGDTLCALRKQWEHGFY